MPPICDLYNTSKQYRSRIKIKQTSKNKTKQNKNKNKTKTQNKDQERAKGIVISIVKLYGDENKLFFL